MALFSGEAQQLFGDAAFLSALDNAAFRQLLGDANLRGLLGVTGFRRRWRTRISPAWWPTARCRARCRPARCSRR